MKLPLLLAHRGGKFWESDDFSYIAESVAAGADIIEFDIRRRDGRYVVQHMPYEKVQGYLEDAIKKIGNATLYLDIKVDLDINEFIAYIRTLCKNPLIIGSYDVALLKRIQDPDVIKNIHCLLPWNAIARARAANAQWVTILAYFATRRVMEKIEAAGFTFIPSGNQIFKKREIMRNQLRLARWGAPLISTHHVADMKKLLEASL